MLHQLSKHFERKTVIIFLPSNLNIHFGCSKDQSHGDGSFEFQQHMFWLRKKKNNFQSTEEMTSSFICLIAELIFVLLTHLTDLKPVNGYHSSKNDLQRKKYVHCFWK